MHRRPFQEQLQFQVGLGRLLELISRVGLYGRTICRIL